MSEYLGCYFSTIMVLISLCTPQTAKVLSVNDCGCQLCSYIYCQVLISSVVTTPLVLGVNDYLGCSVCTIRVLMSNCAPYRCIDSTVWHSNGATIAPMQFFQYFRVLPQPSNFNSVVIELNSSSYHNVSRRQLQNSTVLQLP